MRMSDVRRVLAEVTASQWGLVTSAQARVRGASAMNLSRMTESGELTRLAHGVYKDSGAPGGKNEELRAAWLMTDPATLAHERLSEQPRTAVVSGESASVLLGMGDLRAPKSEFTTPVRRQTQRTDVRYRTRELPEVDVMLWEGLPVTTRERTVADLVEDRQDLSNVADMLRDAVRASRLDTDRLIALLAPLAERNGFRKGDGQGLFEELLRIAGIDLDSLAAGMSAIPELGELVVARYVKRIEECEDASLRAVAEAAVDRFGAGLPPERTQRFLEILTEAVKSSVEPVIREVDRAGAQPGAASGVEEAVDRAAATARAHIDVTMKAIDWSELLKSTAHPRSITGGQS